MLGHLLDSRENHGVSYVDYGWRDLSTDTAGYAPSRGPLDSNISTLCLTIAFREQGQW